LTFAFAAISSRDELELEVAVSESEMEQTYTLSLTGDGISIERVVDQETARAIVGIVLGGRRDSNAAPMPTGAQSPRVSQERMSLREFLNEAEAKRMPDKIVSIGEYLMSHAGQEGFSVEDLRSGFRLAAEPLPANFRRDHQWTVSNGWIAEDPRNPGTYYVTQSGKAAIEAKFSGDVKKKTGFGTKRRRKGSG
jgi:hypothetical protein